MERLTNENGLIKGNFDYQAVKEAVEKLYVLENWLEKENNIEKIEIFSDLDSFTLIKKEPCKMAAREKFKPYLQFKPVEFEILDDLAEVFGKSKMPVKKVGYIGEQTRLVSDKKQILYVGDIVSIRFHEDDDTIIEKVTIIVNDGEESFPMGFKSTEKYTLKRIRKYTELKHGEVYSNCVVAVLKEE